MISAQSAPTIVTLADLATMSVKAKVSETDVSRLKPGTPVVLTSLVEPERHYEARLRTIVPAPDQILSDTTEQGQSAADGGQSSDAAYFDARFEIDNSDGVLRPLMTAQVTFVLAWAAQAGLIPMAAPRPAGPGQGHVTVLDGEGRPRDRAVRTGLASGTEVEILDGVEAGEAVIVAGPQNAATPVRRRLP